MHTNKLLHLSMKLLLLIIGCWFSLSTFANEDKYIAHEERKQRILNEANDRIDLIHKKIKAIIGEAKCQSNSHCKSLPVDSVPCGGPGGYLTYSSNLDEKLKDKIFILAKRTSDLRDAIYRVNRTGGFCVYPSPPELSCESGLCVASKRAKDLY